MNPADPFGLIGQVLDGQFRVDQFVGEGGFSIVYRGHHAGLDEPIAIKCLKLPPALGSALVESFVRRFRDESRIHYRLSQGNLAIARSIASGTTMSSSTSALVPYMVLEWLQGRSLAQEFEVRRQRGMTGRTMDEVVKLLDPAAQGLAFAHAQGVVHRDMNPGNLFLAETRGTSGTTVMTKVLDFGVAKVISDHALELGPRAQTLGHIRIFAPAYGSPEQFDDSIGKVGTASDVYSFALIMLEALRDHPVRDGEHLGEFALMALDEKQRPTPRSLGVPVGDAVEEVFARAVALRPENRPPDMGSFWGSLKNAIRVDAQSGKAPHADAAPSRPGGGWKPHSPAAGQAPPDRGVTADMPAPVVEVSRPGSIAPPAMSPGVSQLQRGTVRMVSSHPAQGSAAGALAATPLTSTLMMEQRVNTPLPQSAAPAKPLAATMAMASPYARSQDVPPYVAPKSPLPPAQAAQAATVAMNAGNASFAAARAMADAHTASATPPPPRAEVPTVVPPPPPKSNAKVIAIVLVALAVVGLAAFAGYRAKQPKTDDTTTTSSRAAPPATPPATKAGATPAAAPSPAATEPPGPPGVVAAAAAVDAPRAQPASPRGAPPGAGSQASAPSPRSTAPPASTPTPIASPPTQIPTPLPSPGSDRGFDPAAARAALDVIDGVLASCRSQGGRTGAGTITVTFGPDGHAQHAMVDEPPFGGTPEGSCVSSRFKQAKIAPFEGAPGSVVYTFHIPN